MPAPGVPARSKRQRFGTTRWSLVLAAGDLRDADSREALAELFQIYWPPLYAFASSSLAGQAAEDAVQGFFVRMLENADRRVTGVQGADPDRGRFRSYLLGAFRHYLSDLHDRHTAAKRGGTQSPISLDVETADQLYPLELRDDLTPDALYEKRWALTVVERAMMRLEAEYEKLGKAELFQQLKGQLSGHSARGDLTAAAAQLGLEPGAVRVASHRLRRRFAEKLREEVAQTVADVDEVEDELRHLLDALRG